MADSGLTFTGDQIKSDSIKKVFDIYGTIGDNNHIVMNNRLSLQYYPNSSSSIPNHVLDSLN